MYFKVNSKLLQNCCRITSNLLQKCFKFASKVLQNCFKSASKVLQNCFKVLQQMIQNDDKNTWSPRSPRPTTTTLQHNIATTTVAINFYYFKLLGGDISIKVILEPCIGQYLDPVPRFSLRRRCSSMPWFSPRRPDQLLFFRRELIWVTVLRFLVVLCWYLEKFVEALKRGNVILTTVSRVLPLYHVVFGRLWQLFRDRTWFGRQLYDFKQFCNVILERF